MNNFRLNLITVVGDFHFPLTLKWMLKHYSKLTRLDEIHIVYYETLGDPAKYQEFIEIVKEFKPVIHKVSGKKYDWDKVTEFYNKFTEGPDWWIVADCDEIQYWIVDPREAVQECINFGKTFVAGGFLDRIGEYGSFPEITSSDDDLDKLFPLVGHFRYLMSGACPNKVVLKYGDQKISSGQHYAVFEDGTNSWGGNHPQCCSGIAVQVHHFKWDSSVLQRLKETGDSRCNYSDEFYKMFQAIVFNKFRIPIEKPKFMIERFNPSLGYHSYSRWNEVFREIQKV